jgi:outer membrane receptor protein involved in Fe transport
MKHHHNRAALLAAFALAQLVRAQTAPTTANPAPADETVKLEAFTVTGSNIKRLEVEKVLPVTILSQVDMDIRSASQTSDLLTALPQITGLPGNETAVAGATARGDNATISLRGIASSNTLVLLNGRRLVPHPITQGEGGTPTLSVNVNILPNRGIDNIEVLRDGASSVYGSDAVAGVVNYTMNRNFRGTELSLRYGQTTYEDGREYRATLQHGFTFAGNRGRVVVTADYYKRDPMFIRDRPFGGDGDNTGRAPAPWNSPTDTTFNLRSTSSAFGQFLAGTAGAPDVFGTPMTFTGARPAGVPASMVSNTGVFVLTPLVGGGVGFATATPARTSTGPGRDYYWSNSAWRVIQPRNARTNVFVRGEFDLNPRVTLFGEAALYQSRSITFREPDQYSASFDSFTVVPIDNPFNPFGSRYWSPTGSPNADGTPRLTGTPAQVSITNKRFIDLPTRTDCVTNNVYRGVAGLRGRIGGSWSWESAALFSVARGIEHEAGATRRSLLRAAINQTDRARAYNPFGRTFAVQGGQLVVTGDYTSPASVIDTFSAPFIRNGITKLGSLDVRANGDVLPLWGGNTLGAAVGGEFRYEAYDDWRPPYAGLSPAGSGLDPTNNDFVSFSPNSDTHGNRHVAAAYVETVLPLVGKRTALPLVRSLELSASARNERYTDFGNTTKPKFGLNWQPSAWAMVRASYNRGFRAPNLAQLFTGTLTRSLTAADTYRSTATQLATDGSANRRSIASGNPNLSPETATGKSAGLVVEVPRVKGLSVAVDYWEIRQNNVIASGGGIAADTAALLAATQAALARGTTINAIDLGSGTPGYQGDSSVVRFPVTQNDRDLFAAYNARVTPGNQRAVAGAISHVNVSYYNRAEQFVNGFDFDLKYRLPRLEVGSFVFVTNWTLLNNYHAYTAPGAARTEYRQGNSANVGGATPKWRSATTLSWRRQQLGAGVGLYYIGRFTDVNATTTRATYESLGSPGYIRPVFNNGAYSYRYVVRDTKTYNAHLSYRVAASSRWLADLDVRLSVNNVFNTEPPLAGGTSSGYETSVYNTLARGRSYALQLTKKL